MSTSASGAAAGDFSPLLRRRLDIMVDACGVLRFALALGKAVGVVFHGRPKMQVWILLQSLKLAVLECCKSWNAAKTVHRKDWPRAWLTSSRGERNRSHHSFTLHSAHFSSAVSRILAFQQYRRCSERATARQVLRKKGAARLSLGAHTICGAEFADGSQDAKRNSRQQDDLSSSSS